MKRDFIWLENMFEYFGYKEWFTENRLDFMVNFYDNYNELTDIEAIAVVENLEDIKKGTFDLIKVNDFNLNVLESIAEINEEIEFNRESVENGLHILLGKIEGIEAAFTK
jgi:hypothetical protein